MDTGHLSLGLAALREHRAERDADVDVADAFDRLIEASFQWARTVDSWSRYEALEHPDRLVAQLLLDEARRHQAIALELADGLRERIALSSNV